MIRFQAASEDDVENDWTWKLVGEIVPKATSFRLTSSGSILASLIPNYLL